jgi:hypothetical protein
MSSKLNLQKSSFTQNFAKIPEHAIYHLTESLHSFAELPDWVSYYSPMALDSLNFELDYAALASDFNQVIHSKHNLFSNHSSFIFKYLERLDKVNVFDLMETKGLNTAPLMLDLIENNQLGYYVPVTSNPLLNDFAINNVQDLLAGLGLARIQTASIQADIHIKSFQTEVLKITKAGQKDFRKNLFLLLNSSLGNSIEPERMLKNISDSMNSGDYLLVVQNIYRSGQENTIANDYKNLLYGSKDSFSAGKETILNINPELDVENDISVKWVETDEFRGVKFLFKIFKETDFLGLELKANQEITMFRSQSFKEERLKNMFRKAGFRILEISYDDLENTAMFFMQKN